VLLPVALIAWAYARQVTPLANHFHDFLLHPIESLLLIPLLLHQAPLFDILPLYVVLLLVTPFACATARRHGWGIVLSVSFLGWFAGVALGETSRRGEIVSQKFRKFFIAAAGGIVLAGLCARHGIIPSTSINPAIFQWMDKWTLGPLRLVNFAAWVVLLMAWNPRPPAWLMEQTALWGRHSLAVFALHLPLVVCAASVIQMFPMTGLEKTFLGLSVIGAISIWVAWLEFNSQQRKQISAAQPRLHRLLHQEIIRSAPSKPTAG